MAKGVSKSCPQQLALPVLPNLGLWGPSKALWLRTASQSPRGPCTFMQARLPQRHRVPCLRQGLSHSLELGTESPWVTQQEGSSLLSEQAAAGVRLAQPGPAPLDWPGVTPAFLSFFKKQTGGGAPSALA